MSARSLTVTVWYCGVLYFSFQVFVCQSQVTLVTRNVTDSFRIGEGCQRIEDVCSDKASCQANGLCLCNDEYPNFRNPVKTVIKGQYDNSYGCVSNDAILHSIENDEIQCRFGPFLVIPNDEEGSVTGFEHSATFQSERSYNCRLNGVYVKYPNKGKLTEITWLDKTYAELSTPTSGKLNITWRKSIRELQGLIIKIKFSCNVTSGDNTEYSEECLEAKVFGTWLSPDKTASSLTVKVRSRRHTNSGSSDPSSSGEDEPEIFIIAIAAGGGFLLLVVVIIITCCLVKRRKRNRRRRSVDSTQQKYGHVFVNVGACEAPEMDANYATAVEEPQYASVNESFHEENPDPYATPEIERIEVNGVLYTVSVRRNKPTKPDVERIEVNGVTYAVADKKNKPQKGENENESADGNMYDEPCVKKEPKEEIKRLEKNGVMYAVADKKNKPQKGESKEDNADGKMYDEPHVKKEPKEEIKRLEKNGVMYAVTDKKNKPQKGESKKDSADGKMYDEPHVKKEPKEEIKRLEKNGVMYAVADKKNKPQKGENKKNSADGKMYDEPDEENKPKGEIKGLEKSGVMYAVADKKSEPSEPEREDKVDGNIYDEPEERKEEVKTDEMDQDLYANVEETRPKPHEVVGTAKPEEVGYMDPDNLTGTMYRPPADKESPQAAEYASIDDVKQQMDV